MEILLLRHGETDWNLERRCQGVSDLELNGSGKRQAIEVAERLRQEPVQAIVSSHLKRAVQTAEAIRRYHADIPVLVEPDFRELDHGHLEGLTFEEVKEKYPDFMSRWRAAPAQLPTPGGESLEDVAVRTWRALERVVARDLDGTAVVVTHNFPILSILCHITATDLNHYRSFRTEPCTLTRIRYEQTYGWQILEQCRNGSATSAAFPNRL